MRVSTFGLEALFLTSVTEVHSVLRECKDFVPPGEEKWYDSSRQKKDCLFFRDGNACEYFGHMFENFGTDAASACCTCGGGIKLDPPIECTDYVPPGEDKWFDSVKRDCVRYANPTYYWYCLEDGESYENFGTTAREACCFCGGGVEGKAPQAVAVAKKSFKIEDDGRGFANKVMKVLEPYIPVQVVPKGDEANLKVVWKGKDYPFFESSKSGVCDAEGLTIAYRFDIDNPEQYFPFLITKVLEKLLGAEKPERCDAGYRYSGKEEISCCTADLLNTLDLSCIKGKQEEDPPCWSPPDTTPVPGKTKLVKVKILFSPQLKFDNNWTEEKSLKELERADRTIAATTGIEQHARFVMYKQHVERRIRGNSAKAVYDDLASVAKGDPEKDAYNVLLYLTEQEIKNENGFTIAGRADTSLCSYGRPSLAIANPIRSKVSVPHELMHVLGGDHWTHCKGYFIVSNLTSFGDPDLGMDKCNANRIAKELSKFTCLETAS